MGRKSETKDKSPGRVQDTKHGNIDRLVDSEEGRGAYNWRNLSSLTSTTILTRVLASASEASLHWLSASNSK